MISLVLAMEVISEGSETRSPVSSNIDKVVGATEETFGPSVGWGISINQKEQIYEYTTY